MRLSLLLCLAAASLTAHAQTPATLGPQVAGLTQDLDLLRDQVGKLAQKVELLTAENQQLKNQISAQGRTTGAAAAGSISLAELNRTLDALRLELRNNAATQRAEISDSVNRQIADLVTKINIALKDVSNGRAPNLANSSASTPSTPATPSNPPAPGKPETVPPVFSKDFPKTGVAYIVQSGDNLTVIAKKHNSSIRWIQDANQISDPVREVKIGRKLFIPQKPAPAEAPVPAPSTEATPTPAN